MIPETKRIRIELDSELARLLEEAGDVPLVLETNEELYHLAKEDDIWAGYDPEKARAALTKSAGALRGIDADELVKDIYRARVQGSRPMTRP